MTPHFFNRLNFNSEHGIFIPLVAGIFFGILAILGLALDVVVIYKGQINVQKAVDAGSLSGANLLLKPLGLQIDEAGIRSAAEKMARVNLELAGFSASEIVEVVAQYSLSGSVGGSQYGESTVYVSASVRPQLFILDKIPGIGTAIVSTTSAVARARSIIVSIVLDRSGSMNATLPGDPNNKLFYLKDAAIKFVERFRNTRDMVSLVSFSDASTTEVVMNDFNGTSAEFTANRDNLVSRINSLAAGGATNHSSGIYRAWDVMRGKVAAYPLLPRFMLIFTDGGSTASVANWAPNPALPGNGFDRIAANQRPVLPPPPPPPTPEPPKPWYYNEPNEGDNVLGTNYWYDLRYGGGAGMCLYNFGPTYGLYLTPHSFVSGAASSLDCGEIPANPPAPVIYKQSLRACLGLDGPIGFYDPDGKLYTEPGTVIDYAQEAAELPLCMWPTTSSDYSLANWSFARLHYLAAVAAADFVRKQGVYIYTIGLGQQDTTVSDFYQTLNNGDLRKDFALNRLANDRNRSQSHDYPDMPSGKAATYAELSSQRQGKYLASDTGQDLETLFQEVFRDIKLQLLQ